MESQLCEILNLESDQSVGYFVLRADWPVWMLPALIAVAALFAWAIYWREKSVGRVRRMLLATLRTALYALILCILFQPVLGVQKTTEVRRNLLVLVDRSESMGIADRRSEPADVAEAALALGKADFAMPEVQHSVARAHRELGATVRLLKQSRWVDARQSQRAVVQAIEAAQSAVKQESSKGEAAVGPVPASVANKLREIAAAQRALGEESEKRDRSDTPLRERCTGIQKAAEDLERRVGVLRADLGGAQLRGPVQISAESASVKRLDIARSLLTHSVIRPLDAAAERFDMRWFTFGEGLSELKGPPAKGEADGIVAAEKGTFAAMLQSAVARYRGQPIAGVVALTDGAFNDDTVDARGVAATLGQQGIPLYLVGIGLASPRDMGLRSLIVQEAFFPKDRITARVQVFANGYEGTATELRVLLDGQEVGRQQVELTAEPRFVDLAFDVPEGKSGLMKLQVIAPELPGETSVANNSIHQPVRVIGQKINVLYVEGCPRWEYRYLRTVLLRDRRLNVKFLLTQGDKELPAVSPEYLAQFPAKAEDAFKFDLIILGDVHSWYFSSPQLLCLKELVQQRGGSLLMLAGNRYAPVTYIKTPVAELLPVKISEEYARVAPLEYPTLTAAGRRSFAMLGATEESSDQIWSLVRPLDRLARLDGLKAGATVLAELPVTSDRREPHPLIAWHRAGTGRAMYIGIDELWRLRYKTGDQYHAAFWSKAIQFLALSRLLGENKRIHLEAETSEVRPGQRVPIRAYVLDEGFQPVRSSEYRVAVDPGASEAGTTDDELVLAAVPTTPGLFQGSFSPTREGRCTIQAPPEDRPAANTLELIVAGTNREQQEPAAQHARLRQMAELSGGEYLGVADWPSLAGLLEGHPRTIVESKEIDLWDHWIPYVLLVLIAGTEWLVRRRSYLV